MKKLLYLLYSLLFFVICAVPGAMLLHKSEDSTAEKRQLAEMPSFRDEEGGFNTEWSTQFQAYVADHFGFRQNLVELDSRLKADLLHVSAEEDVIIGKDGWLFYTPTVDDYLGRPTISEQGLQNIVYNLEMMKVYTESQGSQFVLAVVPNKNTVYPEYMPDYYQSGEDSGNLDNLLSYLSASPVWEDYAFVEEALQSGSDEQIYYHKQDTHWNNMGALIGYRAIMDTTGLDYLHYDEAAYHIEQSWQGDLQNMLFPDSGILDENYSYDIEFDYLYLGHYLTSDDLTINTINASGTGSLLMFRDSFGAAVIPYFSQNFQTARYSRTRPNPFCHLETMQADVVVLEIVERNLAWLQKEAPMHGALKADTVPEADTQGSAECYTDQNGTTYLQLYGTVELPEQLTTVPEYILTLTDTENQALSYQAYHCYEADKLEKEEILDNGWSLYIPLADLTENQRYHATLTVVLPDSCLSCDLGEIMPDFS